MTENKKTIKIDPNLFSVSGHKNNKKKSRTLKKKQNELNSLTKPNNVKKELLRKIKEKYKNKSEAEVDVDVGNDNNDDNFKNEFQKSLNYLENIIKSKEQKKQTQKRKKRKEKLENHNNASNNVSNSMSLPKLNEVNIDISNIEKDTPISNFYTSTNINNNKLPKNINNDLSKEPKYGCLKGGKKPTYKQLNKTLKKPRIGNISNITQKQNNLFKEREKFKKLIQKPKPKKINRKKLMKKLKKYRLKTIKKTYKLGKNKNKVGVLIKNNITRKKIQNEIDDLDKVPLIDVRRYLKTKNLLKTGSSAPEHVLRQIYKDTIISGNIYNKNKDALIHNFFTPSND
jgi:hypothetical protein